MPLECHYSYVTVLHVPFISVKNEPFRKVEPARKNNPLQAPLQGQAGGDVRFLFFFTSSGRDGWDGFFYCCFCGCKEGLIHLFIFISYRILAEHG